MRPKNHPSRNRRSARDLVRRRARELQQLLERRMSVVVDSCDDAIIAKTLDGIIVAWNPAAERMYGYSAREVMGKNISLLFPPEKKEELAAVMERVGKGEGIEHYETLRVRKDGTRLDVSVTVSPIIGPRGRVLGASAIARDITEHKRAEDRIRYLATHDPLTGLANYGTLMGALDRELRRSDRTERSFSLLLLDLDGLKTINDRFGHLVGSHALCRVARILQRQCRSIDTAARFGGDEFAVVLVETDRQTAEIVAERISRQLAADGETPYLSVSIGISCCPDEGLSPEALLAAADRALYREKRRSA